MNTSSGYVYALINPFMKGLVKVGKTTNDPEVRAAMLSSSTGVATPFIVAYFEYFEDCDAAERFVHEFLERSGYRVSKSREFFEVPLHVVVKAISQVPTINNNSLDANIDKKNLHPHLVLAAA